jgi:hypothetical protein
MLAPIPVAARFRSERRMRFYARRSLAMGRIGERIVLSNEACQLDQRIAGLVAMLRLRMRRIAPGGIT